MAFVIIKSEKIGKYIIDFRDKTSVKESAYEWCDKYGKINFNLERTDRRFHNKIVSIPPGYAINIWGLLETSYYCVQNLILCRFSPIESYHMHFADYYGQYTRASLEYYLKPIKNKQNRPFVFLIATLWPHKNCVAGTNKYRKAFIEAVKAIKIPFEGGFFVNDEHTDYEDYRDLIISKWYPNKKYIDKSKLSDIVFNTPAVHDCHGWKLGEFLTLGKAIVSMPLTHELPEKLVHGENIHFVQDTSEIKEAVEKLISDKAYRQRLITGARSYYNKYVSPERVIERLVTNDL
jgi:glycosyltransferase involved in cell wall biosynthesis